MQRSIIVLTITALFGLGVTTAYAGTPAASAQPSQAAPASTDTSQSTTPSFDDLDTHHHGYLLRSDIPKNVEALRELRLHFRDADTDGNGQLSRSEYAAYIQMHSKDDQAPAAGAASPNPTPSMKGH